MGFDATCFVGGVEWVYRLRDDAVSKCVRILAVPPKKNSTRLDAAFVGNSGGRVEERSGIPVAGAVSQVEAQGHCLFEEWLLELGLSGLPTSVEGGRGG